MLEYLDRALKYFYVLSPTEVDKFAILHAVFADDPAIPIDAIILHLLKEGHIFPSIKIEDGQAYDLPNCYSITVDGTLFFLNASIPGNPFQSEENERLATKQRQDTSAKVAEKDGFLKWNWMILPLITFMLGMISTVGGEYFKRVMWPDSKASLPTIVVHDTIYMAPKPTHPPFSP